MKKTKKYQFWFCTGSQDLYGDECLRKVAAHSREMVEGLNASGALPYELVWKPTLIDQASIRRTFNEANNDENCAGVITWMHTFSPSFDCTLYFTPINDSAYFVAIPNTPVIQHQKTAPGPPKYTAVPTPIILPVPIVEARAVVNA